MIEAFAAVFAALYAGHQVGDHWIQTQHQADCKGRPGWVGRWNCVKHVTTYGATQLAALAVLVAVLDLAITPGGLVAGMALNLGTHYLADRRVPLRWLADRTGSGVFYRLGTPRADRDDNPSLGTGAYALDQSWHVAFMFLSAVVIAAV